MPYDTHSIILGTGRAAPEKILTNADLEKIVDTSDAWIVERTGIRERHIAEPGTGLTPLASEAARKALEDAGIEAEQIDLIILGTVTGDYTFPATACLVQEQIGAKHAAAFDISAACSGFLYSLQCADALMRSVGYRHVLVIGGEVLTSILDWSDRNTCTLFGDGAGAAVLGVGQDGSGLIASHIQSNGEHAHLLYNPGCGSMYPPTPENVDQKVNTIRMEGKEVFRYAVSSMLDGLSKVLARAGLTSEDIDLLIPHQANLRIIQAVGKRLDLPEEKIFINVGHYGNTSAASIPMALDEARRSGRANKGDLVAMVTFGAGFTWAAALVRL